MGLLDRLTPRRQEPDSSTRRSASVDDSVFGTKALPKFLTALASREQPVLLDLGPVVGPNVSFFGEHLGCKILVEDIYADLERHISGGRLDQFPTFIGGRLQHGANSIDGILCWDLLDYLEKPAAEVLAAQLSKILRPGGALFAMFGTVPPTAPRYTKFTIVDESNLRYRATPAAKGRGAVLASRDVQRMFDGLSVAESFLLKNQIREMLFRKPA